MATIYAKICCFVVVVVVILDKEKDKLIIGVFVGTADISISGIRAVIA